MDVHAGIAVLSNAALWRAVTDCMTGFPFAVARFSRDATTQPLQHNEAASARKHFLSHCNCSSLPRRDGILPHLAIVMNNKNMLEQMWTLAQQPQYRHDPRLSFTHVMRCAVTFGQIEMLACITELRACESEQQWEAGLMRTALYESVDGVNMRVLEWLQVRVPPAMCALYPYDIQQFAAKGDLVLVQWLHEHGCSIVQSAVDSAALWGHLPVLQYLYHHSLYRTTNAHRAAAYGLLDIVEFIVEDHMANHTSEDDDEDDIDYDSWRSAISAAASNGHLAIVQFFAERGFYPTTPHAMDGAAQHGHLGVVAFLHTQPGSPCTYRAIDHAASGGHLDVVQFLHEHRSEGCSTRAMDSAATRGHLDVIRFLHANRTEGCTTQAMDGAAMHGHLGVLEFLHAHRTEGCTVGAFKAAAANGHVAAAQFLSEHCLSLYHATSEFVAAATLGRLEIVKALHPKVCRERSTYTAVSIAAQKWKQDVVAFLCAHQEHEVTRFLDRAVTDNASWIVQALCPYAARSELLGAKQRALALGHVRIVRILDRAIRAIPLVHTQSKQAQATYSTTQRVDDDSKQVA